MRLPRSGPTVDEANLSSPTTAPIRSSQRRASRAPTTQGEVDGSAPRSRARSARWTAKGAVFAAALAVLVLAIPVLSYTGYQVVRSSRQGQVIDPETDPTKPGFEAVVDPTPTMMVADTNADGALNGVTLLSLHGGDEGGSVVSVPVGTVVELPLTEIGEASFQQIFEISGLEGLDQRVETMATASMQETTQIAVDQWATLLAPVGPLTIDNPAPIVDFAGTQVFAQGPVQVAPDQVGAFLTGAGPFDGGMTRTDRQLAFWEAWAATVEASGDPNVVPGETDRGLGRFVRGLAAGPREVTSFPVAAIPIPGAAAADTTVFAPAVEEIPDFTASVIPFPTGVGRARTRILDGVGQPGLASEAASLMVPAGAEITTVGNDDEFGQETTRIVYFDDEDEEKAQMLQAALGVGELVQGDSVSDSLDVTVILGEDFGGDGGGSPASSVPTEETAPTTVPPIAPGEPGGPPDTSGAIVPAEEPGFSVPPATAPVQGGADGNPNG